MSAEFTNDRNDSNSPTEFSEVHDSLSRPAGREEEGVVTAGDPFEDLGDPVGDSGANVHDKIRELQEQAKAVADRDYWVNRERYQRAARQVVDDEYEQENAKALLKEMRAAIPDDVLKWEAEDEPHNPLMMWTPSAELIGVDTHDPGFVEETLALVEIGGNLLAIANYKVGKTTLLKQMAASLVKGDPDTKWLGAFSPARTFTVLYMDFELISRQNRRWRMAIAEEFKLSTGDRMRWIPAMLRGTSAPSPATEAGRRALVAAWLEQDIDVVFMEPATAWLEGDGNRGEVVKEWTVGVDTAKRMYDSARFEREWRDGEEPLPLTVIISLHTPKSVKPGSETAVGSGRWMGWADEWIVLTKNDSGQRFVSTGGRCIHLDESPLDPAASKWNAALDLGEIGRSRAKARKEDTELAKRLAHNSHVEKVKKAMASGMTWANTTELTAWLKIHKSEALEVRRELIDEGIAAARNGVYPA